MALASGEDLCTAPFHCGCQRPEQRGRRREKGESQGEGRESQDGRGSGREGGGGGTGREREGMEERRRWLPNSSFYQEPLLQ